MKHAIPANAPKPGSNWQHYKGNNYAVVAIGRHTTSGTDMVVYKDGGENVWCRPLSEWREVVPEHGCSRFTEV